jgi:hypothetical protein
LAGTVTATQIAKAIVGNNAAITVWQLGRLASAVQQ